MHERSGDIGHTDLAFARSWQSGVLQAHRDRQWCNRQWARQQIHQRDRENHGFGKQDHRRVPLLHHNRDDPPGNDAADKQSNDSSSKRGIAPLSLHSIHRELRAVAAHERYEQVAKREEPDRIDIAGNRGEQHTGHILSNPVEPGLRLLPFAVAHDSELIFAAI